MEANVDERVGCDIWENDRLGSVRKFDYFQRPLLRLIFPQVRHVIRLAHVVRQVKALNTLPLFPHEEGIILEDGLCWGQFELRLNKVVWIEAFVVNINRLQEFGQVVLLVCPTGKVFLANWTILMLYEPLLNALAVENVIAVEHAANWFVYYWLQADGALWGQEFARFEPYQHLFDIKVLHLFVPLVEYLPSCFDVSELSL